MKNSVFWPFYYLKSCTTLTREKIEEKLLGENPSGFFNFSVLELNKSGINLSYNLTLVQLLKLQMVITELGGEQRSIEIRVRFSNVLLLIYVLQLTIAFACSVLAILYWENGVLKIILISLPILIYIFAVINFNYFKARVLKRLRKQGILSKIQEK